MTIKIIDIAEARPEKLCNKMEQGVETSRYYGSGREKTVCKCPKCGKRHETQIKWAGRGIPRVFCGHCRQASITLCEWGGAYVNASVTRSSRKTAFLSMD